MATSVPSMEVIRPGSVVVVVVDEDVTTGVVELGVVVDVASGVFGWVDVVTRGMFC